MANRGTIGFDLDGVLWRNPWPVHIAPRVREHLRTAPALAGLSPEQADQQSVEAFQAAWRERLLAGEHVAAHDLDGIYQAVCERFGIEPVLDVAALYRERSAVGGFVDLLPGVPDGLRRLRAAGFRLAAVSNGYQAYQRPVLEAAGILDLFDEVLTPEVAGYAKPDPRLFRTIDGLVAHVGDLLTADVLGANLAGVASFWVRADLPAPFRAVPPRERPRAPEFRAYLEQMLRAELFADVYPEATVEHCLPTAVVVDVAEATAVFLADARSEQAEARGR